MINPEVCELPQSQYFGGSCYQIQTVTGVKSWNQAKAECEALSPPHHTVVINSAEEQTFVTGLVSRNERFWIGCSDIANEGTWVCEDGSGMQWKSGGTVTGYWSK